MFSGVLGLCICCYFFTYLFVLFVIIMITIDLCFLWACVCVYVVDFTILPINLYSPFPPSPSLSSASFVIRDLYAVNVRRDGVRREGREKGCSSCVEFRWILFD